MRIGPWRVRFWAWRDRRASSPTPPLTLTAAESRLVEAGGLALRQAEVRHAARHATLDVALAAAVERHAAAHAALVHASRGTGQLVPAALVGGVGHALGVVVVAATEAALTVQAAQSLDLPPVWTVVLALGAIAAVVLLAGRVGAGLRQWPHLCRWERGVGALWATGLIGAVAALGALRAAAHADAAAGLIVLNAAVALASVALGYLRADALPGRDTAYARERRAQRAVDALRRELAVLERAHAAHAAELDARVRTLRVAYRHWRCLPAGAIDAHPALVAGVPALQPTRSTLPAAQPLAAGSATPLARPAVA